MTYSSHIINLFCH